MITKWFPLSAMMLWSLGLILNFIFNLKLDSNFASMQLVLWFIAYQISSKGEK